GQAPGVGRAPGLRDPWDAPAFGRGSPRTAPSRDLQRDLEAGRTELPTDPPIRGGQRQDISRPLLPGSNTFPQGKRHPRPPLLRLRGCGSLLRHCDRRRGLRADFLHPGAPVR
ncbi:hypothetical protein chiPu_0027770, partial [Chiloscyllium punctatum]|nr:hypothetical protein [Chiloscyllium punctatum]